MPSLFFIARPALPTRYRVLQFAFGSPSDWAIMLTIQDCVVFGCSLKNRRSAGIAMAQWGRGYFWLCAVITMFAACSDDSVVESNRVPLETPSFVAEWGTAPKAITLDGSGNVHVATPDENLIRVYSLEGTEVDAWAVVLEGDTLAPDELVFRNSRFVVATPLEIVVVGVDREILAHWRLPSLRGGGFGADAIDADGAGNVYVIDDLENEVVKYAPDGSVRRRWGLGGRGSLVVEFSGIAVTDGGVVYISNRIENRIDVYSPTGELIRSIGREGDTAAEFRTPWGLDISNGVLYASDVSNYRIQILTLWGTYLTEFYSAASSGGPGDMPHLLCVQGNAVSVGFRGAIATYEYGTE